LAACDLLKYYIKENQPHFNYINNNIFAFL
jgi:hypothetical protein